MEENTHELEVVEDHMPPGSVVGKEMCLLLTRAKASRRKGC